MTSRKNIFKTEGGPSGQAYEGFWNWFRKHEKSFHKVVKEQGNVETGFFDVLSLKLSTLKDGFYFLTGLCDDDTVELVITADGAVKNIVFAEELVGAAPAIPGWKFTALKPPLDIENFSIEMAGYKFSDDNLHFYANDNKNHPDEIDITVVHDDGNEENRSTIVNGTTIFLENYLGELDFAAVVDNLTIAGRTEAKKELIPIGKLKAFLKWRQKEFVEKYEGTRRNTENDDYSGLEAVLENGKPLLALVNTDLLRWDRKASHPWILIVEIKYDAEDEDGMPDDATYDRLDEIQDGIEAELKDFDGYLNIGRQTADGVREIYYACKDFRKPSKVLYGLQRGYAGEMEIDYDIYKDKYWRSFDRFHCIL